MNKYSDLLSQLRKNNFSETIYDEDNYLLKDDLINNILKISNFFFKKKKILIFPENNIRSIVALISFINLGSKVFIINDGTFIEDINKYINEYKPDLIVGEIEKIKYLKAKVKIINRTKLLILNGNLRGHYSYENIIKNKKNLNKLLIKSKNSEIICSTSGTTGYPKKIHFTKDKFIKRALASNKIYKIKKGCFLISTPFYHSLALKCLFMAVMSNNKIILIKNFTSFKCIEIFKKNKNIIWHTASSQIKEMIIKYKDKFIKNKNISKIISCADSLDKSFKTKLATANYFFYDTYGCTETDGVTSLLLKKNMKLFDTVGKINRTHDVKILLKNKLIKAQNQIGEICVKTELICNKINNNTISKNYYRTGDLGYLDKNKNLFVTGRKKNLIIISGINIYPERIEEVVLKIKGIKNAVILSKKSIIKGEYLILYVTKNSKINENQIMKYLINKIPSFCLPKKIYFLDKIPINKIGKIDRTKLKKILIK